MCLKQNKKTKKSESKTRKKATEEEGLKEFSRKKKTNTEKKEK